MKYFIVADVHSYYDELMKALNEAGWTNSEDQCFVSLGDLCDRGPDTIKCLEFVNSIPANRKILIRGNHEDLMESAICRKQFLMHDLHNGTVKTADAIAKYEGFDPPNKKRTYQDNKTILDKVKTSNLWNDYVNSTVDFVEIGKNIFVHGWIPCDVEYKDPWKGDDTKYIKNPNWRKGDWKDARWVNGMRAWSDGVKIKGKTIWCGHWHTSWGHCHLHNDGVEFPENNVEGSKQKAHFGPFKDTGICAMDACTAFSHEVNCEVLDI